MRTHTSLTTSQKGFAHVGIILAVAGVLVVGGLVTWRFLEAQKSDGSTSLSTELSKKLATAKCDYNDKDICKFFTSWKEHKEYRIAAATTDKTTGEVSKFTMEIDGDNSHMVTSGSFESDIISIGKNDMYTKTPNGTWWKQTNPEITTQDPIEKPSVEFEEPTTETTEDAKNTTTYKALGKEACGSLTCFKYQVVNSEISDTTEFLWFDTKSYQLRRSLSEGTDSKTDSTFTYDNVTVKAPANARELGPNQYILPGQDEPTTMPSAADYGM